VGYLLGSVIMVTGIIQVVENRFSKSAIWVSILAVLGLIILYDMPFDNLLLPPNGDF
jgi:type IV secretory pathway VirB3-like protein